jgi:hypothetical protein
MKLTLTALRTQTATLVVACLSLCATLSFAAGPPMAILNARNPQVQAVMNVQDLYTPALMRIPGVVGTATGLDANGQLAIKVYVEWPEVFGIPPLLQGVPVEIEVTGRFEARLSTTDMWPRPVPIGISTGHPKITAGTIGCRVVDDDGNVFALSNNHVYANSNDAKIGDPVLQPGPYDGGTSADWIGTLAAFKEIKFDGSDNLMDAAIALVGDGTFGPTVDTATPAAGYGTPSQTTVSLTSANIGMSVKKFGRTTELTTGTVAEINVTVNVCYDGRGAVCFKVAKFVDQISISPGSFSAGGDSGSLIVTTSGNKPVALLFAGSSTRTIASPIDPILTEFGVSIDGSPSSTSDPDPAPDPAEGFTLTATGYKDRGLQKAELTWSGATSTNVDIIRNGSKIATVSNSLDEYTDHIDIRGGGSYTYRVCEAGTSTCSNDATVTF